VALNGAPADDQPAPASRARRASNRLLTRHHPLVLVVTGLTIAFALAYSVLVPLYRGPDERAHVDMVRHYRAHSGYPSPAFGVLYETTVGNVFRDGTVEPAPTRDRPARRLVADEAIPRGSRPTFAELGPPDDPMGNQMTQHPPLYYAVVASVSSFLTGVTPVGLWSFDVEILLYRYFSILALVPLASLASAAVRAVGGTRAAGAVAAAFTLLVPQLTYVGAVVNNDAFVVVLSALAVVAGLRYLSGGSTWSAWTGAAAGAAVASTKATGASVAAWAAVVVVMGAYERWQRGERRDALTALGGSALLVAAGALWYVRNLIRFDDPQPAPGGHAVPPGAEPLSFVSFLPEWVDRISRTFWGVPARRLGISLPWWISHTLTVLTLVAVVVAVVAVRRLWKFTLPLVALCAVQVVLLLRSNYRANRMHVPGPEFSAIQGRYLFALVVPLAVLVAIAVARVAPALRNQRIVLAVAVAGVGVGSVLHAVIAYKMLSRYWAEAGASVAEQLRALFAWSPLPALLTGIVLMLPVGMMVLAGVLSARWLREPTDPDPTDLAAT
jgi:hypothetical protein